MVIGKKIRRKTTTSLGNRTSTPAAPIQKNPLGCESSGTIWVGKERSENLDAPSLAPARCEGSALLTSSLTTLSSPQQKILVWARCGLRRNGSEISPSASHESIKNEENVGNNDEMKKAVFKFMTYVGIFLILPALKILGTRFYDKNVVPKLINYLCGTKPIQYQRQKVVPLATGDVVEIGIGPGSNLQYYDAEKVHKVIGIDPSHELNAIAQKRADQVNLDIEFNFSSAENINLMDASVDSVVCTFSLCSIPNPQLALSEIYRILRPGGKYYFCEHGLSPDLSTRTLQNLTSGFYPSLSGGCHANRDVIHLITSSGLVIEESKTMYLPGSVKFLGYNYWGVASR